MAATANGEIDLQAIDYRVQVAYTVPVEVFVDLVSGTVDHVEVLTGLPVLDQVEAARRESWLTPVPEPVAARAIKIAEESARRGWPGWELVL